MAAFVYLIVFGSLAGFGAYAYALHYMSPTAMGTYAYVNPVVAVIFGRILLGEPISRRVIVAMALMIGAAVLYSSGTVWHGRQDRSGWRSRRRCRREGVRAGAGWRRRRRARQRVLGRA